MIQRRKSIHLKAWDYSAPAWYFVTICCANRAKLLGEIVDGEGNCVKHVPEEDIPSIGECAMRLSNIGSCCDTVLENCCAAEVSPRIDAYVIMPNHIHCIIEVRGDRVSTDLGTFIRYVKSSCTRKIREDNPGITLWQKGYYEHIIRDDADYSRIREYVENNPAQWAHDTYFA